MPKKPSKKAPKKSYDVVIVGAGPAGLAAGIYCGRRGLRTVAFEAGVVGGQMATATLIENYPGAEPVRGVELAERMQAQAERFGCEIAYENVVGIDPASRTITTSSGAVYGYAALILAMGAARRRLGVPGEERFAGKGLSYCASCDGPLFRGKAVVVVGGSDAAVQAALYLRQYTDRVWLVHRRAELRAEAANQAKLAASGVKVLWEKTVAEIRGDGFIKAVVLEDVASRVRRELAVEGVFVEVGQTPAAKLAKDAGIATDGRDFIIVDRWCRTNIPGIFAAGDITGGIFQVAQAVGDGAVAAIAAYNYVKGIKTV